jgi:exodeoxyribonuclease VII large subunit
MFRQSAMTVRFRPENGMSVRLLGSVSMYTKTGTYQFYADRMEQAGMGELYLKFEALKERLMGEGLFDASLKKPLPLLPRGVGIITSSTGAVLHDICTVSWRRNPGMPLYLCPVKVQGEGAAQEIAAAIRRMDKLPEAEVLIVGRGGGSMEDLWPFNEECVARAIAACKTPVVSAVGHETDYTIADFVADVRAATPSAAAELCVQQREALLEAVRQPVERMRQHLDSLFSQMELRLKESALRLERFSPVKRLENNAFRLENLKKRLQNAVQVQLLEKEHRLSQAVLRLRAAGPEETLRRGYALLLRDRNLIRSVEGVEIGQEMDIRLADGLLGVRVERIEREENHGGQNQENGVL